jgi:hypothetical protein
MRCGGLSSVQGSRPSEDSALPPGQPPRGESVFQPDPAGRPEPRTSFRDDAALATNLRQALDQPSGMLLFRAPLK